MTDKPKTLALDANEWRAVLANNLARANNFVTQTEALTPETFQQMTDHLERMKVIVSGWHKSTPPVVPVPAPVAVPAVAAQQPVAAKPSNGAAAPKRRGWPLGKKRGPRNVQSEASH